MKKHHKTTTLTQDVAPRSHALIAIPRPAPRRGVIATAVRLLAAVLLLPVRLPVLALMALARGVAGVLSGAGRTLGVVGAGVLRVPVLLARLLLLPVVGLVRGIAWVGPRAGRGIGVLLLLPVKAVVGVARLVAMLLRGIARGIMFTLRIPFVALRFAGRGVGAVAVPAVALAWGGVRYVAAGIAAVLRGIAAAVAFLGRLAGRGVLALVVGILASLRSLAVGTFVCVRATARAVLWIALLPFLALRLIAVTLARGIASIAVLLAGAARTVAMGLAQLVLGAFAIVRVAARGIALGARSVGTAVGTKEPQRACYLPLATLSALGVLELTGTGGFPFATLGLLLLGTFAALALLPRPTSMVAVLLSWGLAVAAAWRAEIVSASTPAWIDALVYLTSLAAIRSAYVAARGLVRDAPAAWRSAQQERAHRRASRAIGIVLAVQCVVVAAATQGSISGAPLFGELLLVGVGLALAWVVRTGHYVLLAQIALTIGAAAALVGTIATEFAAFAAGRLFTATSLGAFGLLLIATTALIVVVHTRLLETE